MIPEILSLGAGVAVLTKLAKPALEKMMGASGPIHDAVVQAFAIVLAMLLEIADYFITHQNSHSLVGLEQATIAGFLVGVTAISTYHLVTGRTVTEEVFDEDHPTIQNLKQDNADFKALLTKLAGQPPETPTP